MMTIEQPAKVHDFDQYLSQINAGNSAVNLSSDWMQGRSGFGGLVAALVYESMREQLTGSAPVRCLQISFVGPVDDSALEISSEVLREGRNVSHVLGRGMQNGVTKVLVQGSFGVSRESVLLVEPEKLVLSGDVTKANKMPYIKDVIPEFTKHFNFQYLTPFPFMGAVSTYLEGMVCFAKAPSRITEAHILGLVDSWPPTTLPMMKSACAASSLSWTIEFVQPSPRLGVEEFALYRADVVDSRDGYGYARAKFANSEGELIAISQQTVTHFA